ncbi:MAG TPA: membrane protein insertase YidC, partial [Burkholderiales bacterium]|nr:membrane protein insertase YidC [Burkholderiales bacterium]
MDYQRLILLFIFGFSVLMLWEAWQKETRPAPQAAAAQQAVPAPGVPEPAKPGAGPAALPAAVPGSAAPAVKGETVRVRTDLLAAEIDTVGGTLKRLELLKHKDSTDPNKNFVLLGPEHQYEAQSGLTGDGPNHRALWKAEALQYELQQGNDKVEVRLTASAPNGVSATKTYTFRRDSYLIDVAMDVRNDGKQPASPYVYFQSTHDGKGAADANKLAQSFGAQSFVGFAVYSADKHFQKVHPSDIDKAKVDAQLRADNGWLAVVQHYFVSSWIVADKTQREYVFEKRPDGVYVGRVLVPLGTIAPGASARTAVELYAGPQENR